MVRFAPRGGSAGLFGGKGERARGREEERKRATDCVTVRENERTRERESESARVSQGESETKRSSGRGFVVMFLDAKPSLSSRPHLAQSCPSIPPATPRLALPRPLSSLLFLSFNTARCAEVTERMHAGDWDVRPA
eukprot:2400130-Rhodomonas_salina.1